MTPLLQILSQIPGHPLVHALGWTLLHFLWQGALVAILLWCVLGALSGRSSQTRYAAACFALELMVILPLATFAHVASAEYARRAATANTTIVIDAGMVLQVAADTPAQPIPARIAAAIDRCVPWILLAWFAGVLIFVGRLNFGLVVARRLKHAETELPSTDLLRAFDALRLRLGIARAVRLLHSARVQVPTVIGWLRPVVLIPASCLTGLSTEQIEAIFCHELAHIRRHDYLVSVFQSIVETLLFYHPAVWWVSKQVRRERECCCDAVAVAIGGDVLAYARALSYLEERRAAFPEFVLGANGGALKMRIKRLLGRPENSAASQLASIALLAILLVGAAATIGKHAHAQAAATTPSTGTRQQTGTEAAQRALALEMQQLQQSLNQIEEARPEIQQQVEEARHELEKADSQLQTLKAEKEYQNLLSKQNPQLQKQMEEAQRKAQETLKTLNSDQLRKQFAEAQAALATINSDELRKQLDEALKNQDNAAYRQKLENKQLENKLNSPEFRKQMQDAESAAARLNSPELRKQLEDASRQLSQLLAENKAVTALQDSQLHFALQPPPSQPQLAAPWKPAPPNPTGPQRVSPGVMQGSILHMVNPVYPPIAKQAHVQGAVVLHALISKDGTVEDLKVISGAPMLIASAIDAVKQWKYTPYMIDGKAVEVETTIEVNYTLAPDLSCTYYSSGVAHAGTCEESTTDKGNYSCRADDNKALVQQQTGCESKVKRLQDSPHDNPVPAAILITPAPPSAAAPNQAEYEGIRLRKLGGDVTTPVLIYKDEPTFTDEARKNKFMGIVLVNLIVDTKGQPQNVHVLRGVGMGLDEKAVTAVKQYKFKPATENGNPVPVALNVEVNFQVF